MPLTFAHPAAVLPFSRKSRYIHFSAVVLGSMAPDFEYFLRGQPLGEIGHTFSGFLLFNLPLVTVIYFIYHIFVHQTLFNHLPAFLQDFTSVKRESGIPLKVIVFCYSALFGMLTHVIWDSFTHKNGFMVLRLPVLNDTLSLLGHDIPIYKLLQHGSTLFGITLIVIYMTYRAFSQKKPDYAATISSKQKIVFWSLLFLLTMVTLLLWYLIDYISVLSYGIAVVRVIDSFLVSLLILSIFLKYRAAAS